MNNWKNWKKIVLMIQILLQKKEKVMEKLDIAKHVNSLNLIEHIIVQFVNNVYLKWM